MRYAIAAMLAVLILSGCGGSSPDRGACKAAMKKDFSNAELNPNSPPASEPPACHGIPQSELKKIVGEILTGS